MAHCHQPSLAFSTFLSWWLWGSFDLTWQRKQNILLLFVSWIGSMKCSVSTRASSRGWASYGWARNSCGRNNRSFQDRKCLGDLNSIVKPHAESCNLSFYPSDTRINCVSHGQELQLEVGHCWRLVKKGWHVFIEKGTENQSHLESRISRVSPGRKIVKYRFVL